MSNVCVLTQVGVQSNYIEEVIIYPYWQGKIGNIYFYSSEEYFIIKNDV